MEVVKHGKYYNTITCKKCECVYNYCKKDIEHYFSTELFFECPYYEGYDYVICPECGEKKIL